MPSRLELARQLVSRSEALTAVLGHPIAVAAPPELDADGRRAVGEFLPILFDTLAAISGDDLGREALAAITTIEISAGASAELTRPASDTLTVRVPKLLADAFEPTALRAAIEKLL